MGLASGQSFSPAISARSQRLDHKPCVRNQSTIMTERSNTPHVADELNGNTAEVASGRSWQAGQTGVNGGVRQNARSHGITLAGQGL